MAKLKGQAKQDFLARMRKGREAAAKKKKSKSKSKKSKSKVKPSKTRRNRGGSASDISKESRALLLAIKDPNIKEIVIRK